MLLIPMFATVYFTYSVMIHKWQSFPLNDRKIGTINCSLHHTNPTRRPSPSALSLTGTSQVPFRQAKSCESSSLIQNIKYKTAQSTAVICDYKWIIKNNQIYCFMSCHNYITQRRLTRFIYDLFLSSETIKVANSSINCLVWITHIVYRQVLGNLQILTTCTKMVFFFLGGAVFNKKTIDCDILQQSIWLTSAWWITKKCKIIHVGKTTSNSAWLVHNVCQTKRLVILTKTWITFEEYWLCLNDNHLQHVIYFVGWSTPRIYLFVYWDSLNISITFDLYILIDTTYYFC